MLKVTRDYVASSFSPSAGFSSTSSGLREGVEDLLDVIVLFELVDQAQGLGRLVLGQFGGHRADVLMLGRQRGDAPLFQSLLQLAEIIEGAADHQLRLALVPRAVAPFFPTVVYQ